MSSKHRTHRMEKLARIYDDEILPVWSQKFGQVLLRGLTIPERSQILDVACGTGYPTTELNHLKDEGTRIIGIEASPALLDVARKKLEDAKQVYLRSQGAEPKLKFADGVYDLVVCNVAIQNMSRPAAALADFARVTRPGGEVRVTLPVEGSFGEFFDIYREVLTKHDKHDTLGRLRSYVDAAYPSVETCEAWLASSGLVDTAVDVEEFVLLFRSSREFFFAPVIEYGPLARWKAVAGSGQEMQDVFWYIKECIDSYFEGRAFEVTIRAACLRGRKPEDEDGEATSEQPTIDPAELEDDLQSTTNDDRADRFGDAAELEAIRTDSDEIETKK